MLEITDSEFNRLRDIMYEATGVRLTDTKKHLAVFRLRRRLTELKIGRFGDYLALVKKPGSVELETFINAITTNETFFYRHPQQFDWLNEKVLPDLLRRKKGADSREIRIWSAACSTGEESYSIAIACKMFFKTRPDWGFVIYASDINSAVLEFSRAGRYGERSVAGMPAHLRKLYFSPVAGVGGGKTPMFQVAPEILRSVRFLQHNLLKPFPYRHFDVIFLRNVMIYFDRESKQEVVRLLEERLNEGGYFFISMTETLAGLRCHLKHVGSGVYQKITEGHL